MNMTFNPNGQFKIVQFTDLHWGDGDDNDRKTRELMQRVLVEERPDLVVGDVIEDGNRTDPKRSIQQAVEPMEESGTPWALVFGNHDSEARISREELMASLYGVKHGLTERGPDTITGVGNYIIRLTGRHDARIRRCSSWTLVIMPNRGSAVTPASIGTKSTGLPRSRSRSRRRSGACWHFSISRFRSIKMCGSICLPRQQAGTGLLSSN